MMPIIPDIIKMLEMDISIGIELISFFRLKKKVRKSVGWNSLYKIIN